MLTFHVTERESFPPQAVRRSIDIDDGLLTQRDPDDPRCLRVSCMYTADNFIDGLQGGLTKRIDVRARDITEVDGTSDAVRDIRRATEPLV